MTDRSKLLALAEAVEKLTGPDREVDAEIARTVYADNCRNPDWECGYVLAYTASLDSAMTLVPDDEEWSLHRVQYDNKMCPAAFVNFDMREVLAATPALALCAAALRAQAEALS